MNSLLIIENSNGHDGIRVAQYMKKEIFFKE